ncbi:hypothetical protein ACFQX6_13200 [Streptosporangium lutulentum]
MRPSAVPAAASCGGDSRVETWPGIHSHTDTAGGVLSSITFPSWLGSTRGPGMPASVARVDSAMAAL